MSTKRRRLLFAPFLGHAFSLYRRGRGNGALFIHGGTATQLRRTTSVEHIVGATPPVGNRVYHAPRQQDTKE